MTNTAAPRSPSRLPASPVDEQEAAAPGWHRLSVRRVRGLGDDAVAVTLDVPPRLAGVFAHRAGQHLVVRHRTADGNELRRSYSVCPPPDDPAELRLVVRRLGPGGFADHACRTLAPGDVLEVSRPTGEFALADRPGAHHVLIAGGSGVTPLLAMAAAALREDPHCRVSMVCADRTSGSVLLADELADLKDAHLDRFFVWHVLSRETREAGLLSGRITPERLPGLLSVLGADPGGGERFYLCGPWSLVETVREALADWGADPARVRCEYFTSGAESSGAESSSAESSGAEPQAGQERESAGRAGLVSARLAGRTTTVRMAPQDRVVLDTVLRARPETPYSCRDGLCGSCRARVTAGSVTMDRQYALGSAELAAGYTLPCRARPESDEIGLDFDA